MRTRQSNSRFGRVKSSTLSRTHAHTDRQSDFLGFLSKPKIEQLPHIIVISFSFNENGKSFVPNYFTLCSYQSYILLQIETDFFKPSFKNSPNSAEAVVESVANGRGAQLLYVPANQAFSVQASQRGVNQLCVCYSSIPLTLALFLPLYSSFPG